MKRLYTRLGLTGVMLAFGMPLFADEPIFFFDFEDESQFVEDFKVRNDNNDVDNNGTDITWMWKKYTTGTTPYYYASCYNWKAENYNDVMTTKRSYSLQKGKAYKLSFEAFIENSTGTAMTLAVGYFPKDNEDAITRIYSCKPEYINKYNGEKPKEYDAVFEVEEDGEYNILVMAIGGTAGVAVDNLKLIDYGSPLCPSSVGEITAVAASDFSLGASLSFLLPSKTVTGAAMADNGVSKVEIYRNGALAATLLQGLTPGTEITWEDNAPVNGVNTYKVLVYSGGYVSNPVEKDLYVGPMTPLAPTSATVKKNNGGKLEVSWVAPTMSLEEQTLDPLSLTYKLSRIVDGGEPVVIAESISETSFIDDFSSEDQVSVEYSIVALYSGRVSEELMTSAVKIGALAIPYEESFGDGVLPDGWTIEGSETGNYAKNWEVRDKMVNNPSASSFDNDNGLLAYNSYSAQSGAWSVATTPEIKLNGVSSPVLEFMFYHSYVGQSKEDRVIVMVSKDGGEFEEVEGFEINRYKPTQGWKKYEIPLATFNDAEKIRIAFKAISNNGYDMAIDAIKVYAGASYDLEASSLEAPASVNTGESGNFKISVRNNAFSNVAGTDYYIKVYFEGELYQTIPGVDIAAKQSADLEFSIDSHAGHVANGLPVYFEIDFPEDEDLTNNTSAEVNVNVVPYSGKNVSEIKGELIENTLHLTWKEIEVENYEPMDSEITLDEEEDLISKEDYTENNSIAWPETFIASDGKAWRNIDHDGLESANVYTMPAAKKGFMVVSQAMTGNANHKDYSNVKEHGMLIAVPPVPGGGAASDYLVSPLLPGEGNHKLTFMAKSLTMAQGADFYVEYCTEPTFDLSNIESNFLPIGSKISIPAGDNKQSGTWKEYSFELPSDAKYVAIRFVGESKIIYDRWGDPEDQYSVLCLDNIKLISEPIAQPTYNVYYREYASENTEETASMLTAREQVLPAPARHNNEEIVNGEYVLSAPTVATDFHVSAVYPQGETAVSAPYRFDVPTGVDAVSVENADIVKVTNREIAVYNNDIARPFDVYDIEGRLLATGIYKYVPATSGAYIVKVKANAVTVMVK